MPRDRDDDRYDDDEDDRPRRRRSRRDDDDDDRPPPPKSNTGKTLLIVFGVLAAVSIPCIAVMIGLLLPAVQKVREAAGRVQASNNMKVVGLGMHNHADRNFKLHGPFADPPPGATVPPNDRLSWRVSLLPYIEQGHVFNQFKLDQPWNGPANAGPANTIIKDYCDPLDGQPSVNTRIRCFFDNGALFDSDPSRRVSFSGVSDGTSNTIAYVESADTVKWAQFNEFRFEPHGTPPKFGHPQRSTFMVVMADGSVRSVSKSIDPQVLKMAITKNGGEVLPPDWDR